MNSKYDELNFYSKKIHNLSKNDEYKEKIMSEEIEENVRAHEKYLAGLFQGMEEGETKGKIETQTRIVKNLLNNSVPDEVILKSTNISVEELEKIKKELK